MGTVGREAHVAAAIAQHIRQPTPNAGLVFYQQDPKGLALRAVTYTLAYTACRAAHELGLAALVCPTLSGRSARLISAHRPTVPIYALSPGRETVRRCGLMWGVRAEFLRRHEVTEELLRDACRRVVELGWCKRGQRVAVTAGLPSGVPGSTSLFQVQEL